MFKVGILEMCINKKVYNWIKFHVRKLFFLVFIMIVPLFSIKADTTKNLVNIYFFHSDTCFHCENESRVLDLLEKKYDNVVIYRYEIHENNNNEIRESVTELYDIKTDGVPLTIIGDAFYVGFKENTSKIEFIKTIEYYSRYGYVDKVGKLLQKETSSFIKLDDNVPTLEEFMDTYGNYQLVGGLQTNDLKMSTNAMLLGILSQLNSVKITTIIGVLLLLSKIKSQKSKILIMSYFLGISFFCAITYIILDEINIFIFLIVMLVLFMLGLFLYIKKKKRYYLYSGIFGILIIVCSYLEYYFCSKYLLIWKKLLILYDLVGNERIDYYINYILTVIMINIIIILFLYVVQKNIITRINFGKKVKS